MAAAVPGAMAPGSTEGQMDFLSVCHVLINWYVSNQWTMPERETNVKLYFHPRAGETREPPICMSQLRAQQWRSGGLAVLVSRSLLSPLYMSMTMTATSGANDSLV